MTDFLSLLAHYHIESAILAAMAGAFWGGWRAAGSPAGNDVRRMIRILGLVLLAGTPLLAWDLLRGCFSVHGLGFWLVYPIPSVFFGYSLGRLFRTWELPFARGWTVAVLLAVGVGIFFVELFTLPQVYFHNHVWGGWPGPLYDEVVELDESTLYFRMLTLCWALLLWFLPGLRTDRISRGMVAGSALMLLLGYVNLADMGVATPTEHLRERLGGEHRTDHFELYFDREAYDDFEVKLRAAELEFHLSELADTLKLAGDFNIHAYLYAHPWQKKELTGAKFTSYVPVWLTQDQLHIARDQLGSLRHELVHVVAKRFGNRLLNASWSIGLVEGTAVALAPDPQQESTADQLVAADPPWPSAEQIKDSFSFWGFYGGRSGVNYTAGGSLAGHLLRSYPVHHFKEAYRSGDIEGAYPVTLDSLVRGWHRHLEKVEVDSSDHRRAERLFGIPSILELDCPHVASPAESARDRYQLLLAERDTLGALRALDRLAAAADSALPVMAEWSYRNLKAGRTGRVRELSALTDSLPDLQMLYADAHLLSGDTISARRHLERARELADSTDRRTLERAFRTRSDTTQWIPYLDLSYRDILPEAENYGILLTRTLVQAADRAMDLREWEDAERLGEELFRRDTEPEFRDTYLRLVHLQAFRGGVDQSRKWLARLSAGPEPGAALRERISRESRWIAFLDNVSRDRYTLPSLYQ